MECSENVVAQHETDPIQQDPESWTVPGGHSGGETPVPIPNTEVKPSSADGTAWATARESRSPPGFIQQKPPRLALPCGLFVFPVFLVVLENLPRL